MNGLFYLDEIFYSENSPYLYDIDTLSSINQSKPIRTMEHYVNIMLDSGFKAVFGDKQVMQYDLPSRREGPGVEIRPAPGIWNLPVELQPSRVPFMANGRGSGKRANRQDFWADPAETDLYLFRAIRFALRGVRYSVRKNNLCTEKYEPV